MSSKKSLEQGRDFWEEDVRYEKRHAATSYIISLAGFVMAGNGAHNIATTGDVVAGSLLVVSGAAIGVGGYVLHSKKLEECAKSASRAKSSTTNNRELS